MLLFATCALVANALFGESGLIAIRIAGHQQDQLAERIADLRSENDALRERARRLREDLTFIEEIARRDFGLIRPGERVFILRPDPGEADMLGPAVEP